MMSLIHDDVSEGSPPLERSCVDATPMRIVIAATMPTTHPARNARLFCFARSLNNIKITAMTGTGLIATPSASGRNSPIDLAHQMVSSKVMSTASFLAGGTPLDG